MRRRRFLKWRKISFANLRNPFMLTRSRKNMLLGKIVLLILNKLGPYRVKDAAKQLQRIHAGGVVKKELKGS